MRKTDISNITVTGFKSFIYVPSPKGRCFEVYDRLCYGLSFCREGQITYTHKGKKFVSDPGHAILLPQGQSYTLHGDKTGVFPVINFFCTDFVCDTFLVFPIDNPLSFIRDFEQIKALCSSSKNKAKIMSIFYSMLSRLCPAGKEHKISDAATEYILSNLHRPELANEDIARSLAVSEVYFRKLFTADMGISPKQFILKARMELAKRLLTDSFMSVTDISCKCGFSSVYHFCRSFRNHTAMTPTEYRAGHQIPGI